MSGAPVRMRDDAAEHSLSPQEIIAQSFALAAAAHGEGRLEEAEQLYRAILGAQPTHADSLHGLGVLAHQIGRSDLAAEFLTQALAQRGEPTFHNNLALVQLALDRPHAALASIYRALALRAEYPEAYNALGNVQQKLGQRDEAAASYEKALALRPDYADARANLGKVLLEKGAFDAAMAACRAAVARNPLCAEAQNTLGNVLRAKGENADAVECFDKALQARPHYAEAYNNKGVALMMLQRMDEAMAAIRCALACNPDFSTAAASFGSALFAQGKFDESIPWFERAFALDPDCLEAYNNLGATLLQLDRADEAILAFEKAIDLSEESARAESHYNLGTTLIATNRPERAIASLGKALAADPNYAAAHNNLGVAYQDKGDPEEAISAYTKVIAVDPQYAGAYSNKLMAMHYIETYSNADVLEVARAFGKAFDRSDPRPFAGRDPSPERKLRIGYVSGDFASHPVAFFFARTLAAHDREKFEIFCYSNWANVDFMTEELRGLADHWRLIVGMADAEAADAIRADEIDILVDLAGHTNRTRVVLFGLKPAPIQVEWIGYFGTTGLQAMDYLVLDPVSAPPGADRFYVESLVRLPHGRFCYKPPAMDVDLAEPPCVKQGFVTFGCFNNVAKLSPGAIALWAEILTAAPRSRLILKWRSLSEASVRTRFLDAFARAGIEPGRILLRGASPYRQLLGEYNEIDIALDPFPFGGATTSCEALWMGVPVVTLPGDRLASRQTLGFLHEMGFAELAAESPQAYMALAVGLAGDPERLADLRRRLRPAMEGADFCNGPKFTVTLEAAYRQMWRRHVAGEKPAPIEIAPSA